MRASVWGRVRIPKKCGPSSGSPHRDAIDTYLFMLLS